MHAERDILVRSVFPELRRRAAPLCLHLQEVDLRWGVTEEESARASEICLQEVCRSQVLLGILGERYGLVPPRPSLPELPHYSWVSKEKNLLMVFIKPNNITNHAYIVKIKVFYSYNFRTVVHVMVDLFFVIILQFRPSEIFYASLIAEVGS